MDAFELTRELMRFNTINPPGDKRTSVADPSLQKRCRAVLERTRHGEPGLTRRSVPPPLG